MAPDINDLGLPPEEIAAIDYDAPEPGQFPAMVYPGTYQFTFKLAEDPFDAVEIEGKKYLQVVYSATATVRAEDTPGGEPGGDPVEVSLNYQRVNAYKHPKMSNSSLGDLIRALGLKLQGALTPQLIANTLKEVDGRAQFTGEVGWRAYCKSDEHTISTNPRKKKGDTPWPRTADGKPELQAQCPKCKQKMYGNADIVRHKLPQGAEQAATA